MLRRSIVLLLGASLVFLGGCRTAPIYDVVGAQVVTPKPATMETVQNAIVAAEIGLGWGIEPKGPGTVTGVLDADPSRRRRSHL